MLRTKWLVFPCIYTGNASVWENKHANKPNLLVHLVFWEALGCSVSPAEKSPRRTWRSSGAGRGTVVRGGGLQHHRTHLPSFRGFHTEKNRTTSRRSLGMIRSLQSDGCIGGVWLNNRKSFTSAGVLSLSPIPFAAEQGSCCQMWVLLFEWRLSALLLEHIPLPRG